LRARRGAVGVDDAHMRAAARTGAGDDAIGDARGAQRGDVHAAGEVSAVGEELSDELSENREHADVRAAARTGSRAGVGLAVVDAADVDLADRDVDAAGEVGVVGEELVEELAVLAEHSDVRSPARAGAGDDVVGALAVEVAGGDMDAAVEAGVV